MRLGMPTIEGSPSTPTPRRLDIKPRPPYASPLSQPRQLDRPAPAPASLDGTLSETLSTAPTQHYEGGDEKSHVTISSTGSETTIQVDPSSALGKIVTQLQQASNAPLDPRDRVAPSGASSTRSTQGSSTASHPRTDRSDVYSGTDLSSWDERDSILGTTMTERRHPHQHIPPGGSVTTASEPGTPKRSVRPSASARSVGSRGSKPTAASARSGRSRTTSAGRTSYDLTRTYPPAVATPLDATIEAITAGDNKAMTQQLGRLQLALQTTAGSCSTEEKKQLSTKVYTPLLHHAVETVIAQPKQATCLKALLHCLRSTGELRAIINTPMQGQIPAYTPMQKAAAKGCLAALALIYDFGGLNNPFDLRPVVVPRPETKTALQLAARGPDKPVCGIAGAPSEDSADQGHLACVKFLCKKVPQDVDICNPQPLPGNSLLQPETGYPSAAETALIQGQERILAYLLGQRWFGVGPRRSRFAGLCTDDTGQGPKHRLLSVLAQRPLEGSGRLPPLYMQTLFRVLLRARARPHPRHGTVSRQRKVYVFENASGKESQIEEPSTLTRSEHILGVKEAIAGSPQCGLLIAEVSLYSRHARSFSSMYALAAAMTAAGFGISLAVDLHLHGLQTLFTSASTLATISLTVVAALLLTVATFSAIRLAWNLNDWRWARKMTSWLTDNAEAERKHAAQQRQANKEGALKREAFIARKAAELAESKTTPKYPSSVSASSGLGSLFKRRRDGKRTAKQQRRAHDNTTNRTSVFTSS